MIGVITGIVIVVIVAICIWSFNRDVRNMEKKNKKTTEIIHFDHNGRYACNEAVAPTKEKLTENWNEVTCKNCPKVKFYY